VLKLPKKTVDGFALLVVYMWMSMHMYNNIIITFSRVCNILNEKLRGCILRDNQKEPQKVQRSIKSTREFIENIPNATTHS
jgi:uncharacterized membrane protein